MKNFLLLADSFGCGDVGRKIDVFFGVLTSVQENGFRSYWRLDVWALSSDGKLLLWPLRGVFQRLQ